MQRINLENYQKVLVYNTLNCDIKKYADSFDRILWLPKSSYDESILNFLLANSNFEYFVQKNILENTNIVKTEKLHSIDIPFVQVNQNNLKKKKVLFFAQSDTLVQSILHLFQYFSGQDILLTIPAYFDENSEIFCVKNNLPFKRFSKKILDDFKPDVVCLLNDWAKEAKRVLFLSSLRKIPVVCIQESIIDFGDKTNRMQSSPSVMIQGAQTFLDLKTTNYFLTGNPRYLLKNNEFATKNVLINCNFTYGIHEDIRDVWLDDIVTVLNKENYPYKISQHPRDKGDLSKYGANVISSNASNVSQQIAESSIIITRFSSLIHEGLLQFRPVIYYNPHLEKMKYNFRMGEPFLQYCENYSQLEQAINRVINLEIDGYKEDIKKYLSNHCLIPDQNTNEVIFKILNNGDLPVRNVSFYEKFLTWLYHPKFLFIVRRTKQVFHGA